MKQLSGPRKSASNLSNSLHQHLNMYAMAAGAAGVGMLVSAPATEGKIVYTPANVQLSRGSFYRLDLNGDGIVDYILLQKGNTIGHGSVDNTLFVCRSLFRTSRGVNYCASSGSAPVNDVRVNGSAAAAPLRAGAVIQRGDRFKHDSRSVFTGGVRYPSFTSKSTNWFGPWVNGGKGVKNRYLGLRFKIKNRFHFGWARLTVTTSKKSFTTTLTGYAYETIAGKSIKAGQTHGPATDDLTSDPDFTNPDDPGPGASLTTPDTPQPASLGMLALGSQGVPLWRRKELALEGD